MTPAPRRAWAQLTVAWVLVGAPLLWGIAETVKKALQLFE